MPFKESEHPRSNNGQFGAGAEQANSVGAFGQIHTQYHHNAAAAIERLIRDQSGEAVGALHHPAIGDIDLVWGKAGTLEKDYEDGYGLAKIAIKHPEVIGDLQGVIAKMAVKQQSRNRIILENDTHKSVVRLDWDGANKHWLVTAFEKEGAGVATRTGFNNIAGQDCLTTNSIQIIEQILNDYHMKTTTKPTANAAGMDKSARVKDSNGWIEIKDNPISKVGVFDYLGTSIGAPDAGKIYKVYRPESALNNEETINSFKLLPWIDDHAMLGDSGMPAERKGIEGVIGEDVYYDAPFLRANIKVFSENLAEKIQGGKIELSVGYKCKYELTNGVTPDGEHYDAVQTQILGNHLALVDAGRMGSEVSVQDHADTLTFTIDSKELIMNPDEIAGGAAVPEAAPQLHELISTIATALQQLQAALAPKAEPSEAPAAESEGEPSKDEMPADAINGDPDKANEGQDAAILREVTALRKQVRAMQSNTMDAALQGIAKRDALITRLTPHIGAFAHAAMTEQKVAAYAVKKLGLTGCDGAELVGINAWLQASKPTSKTYTLAADSAPADSIQAYLNGGK